VGIHLNFIGQFAPLAEAEQSDDGGEGKRAVWREYKRNERAKKKQAQANEPAAQEPTRKSADAPPQEEKTA